MRAKEKGLERVEVGSAEVFEERQSKESRAMRRSLVTLSAVHRHV